ncbi:MAG: alpha/beta hydrolase [Pedobacter sp.]|nr:MAG: alpha/beta hydrolase [Pedobacter sp.]
MRFTLSLIMLVMSYGLSAQTVVSLYDGPIQGSKADANYVEKEHIGGDGNRYISFVSNPTLTIYEAPKDKATDAAVIICPGGGYQVLAVEHEGEELAKRFNEFGITAFVLKYRLPSDAIMVDKSMAPLEDAQKAIFWVRKNAAKWKLDLKKIGIVGSSAGGHLAATAGTHFQKSYIKNTEKLSLRPDFMVLLYPVISFGALAHTGSAKNLIGSDLSKEKTQFFSNETQVNSETPPAFLIHASDDKVVSVKNSLLFYEALVLNGVAAEMHLYRAGGHGFGLKNKTSSDDWFIRLINWLKDSKLI